MKPAFAYYGGKNRLAPWIVEHLPPHRVYLEPFAGSAAVLLAKPRSTHEIINDVDGNLVRFLRVLRERPDELALACALTPYARDEFELCVDFDPALDDLELARRWWVRISQGFAATGHATTGWSVSVIRNANNARSMSARVDRFLAVADRLAGVAIENRNALEVLERYGATDATAYIDPPYFGEARNGYKKRAFAGGDYPHEFDTEADHRALAERLHAFPGAVVLSGYRHPLYDELYAGWDSIERSVIRRAGNGRSSSLTHVAEVLWSNRPLDGRLPFAADVPRPTAFDCWPCARCPAPIVDEDPHTDPASGDDVHERCCASCHPHLADVYGIDLEVTTDEMRGALDGPATPLRDETGRPLIAGHGGGLTQDQAARAETTLRGASA